MLFLGNACVIIGFVKKKKRKEKQKRKPKNELIILKFTSILILIIVHMPFDPYFQYICTQLLKEEAST